MKTSIMVFYPEKFSGTVKQRTIRVRHGEEFFKCAWCRLRKTRPLCSFIVEGPQHHFQTIACFCDDCGLATIVEIETGVDGESEV